MAASAAPSPASVGRRLLGEVEETSLEDVLQRIRAQRAAGAALAGGSSGRPTARSDSATTGLSAKSSAAAATGAAAPALRLPSFPIPALQQLVARHFRSTRAPELVAGGQRPLALAYLLVATLVAAPLRQTVVVVDAEARFDPRQLLGMQPRASALHDSSDDKQSAQTMPGVPGAQTTQAIHTTHTSQRQDATHALSMPVTADDLQHVHVFRADPRWRVPLSELVAAAEQRVLYGGQRRRDRPWWGTIVVGCASGSGNTASDANSGDSGTSAAGSTLGHGMGAALATGPYGWLRIDRQERDVADALQERQRQLVNLLMAVSLDDSSLDKALIGTPCQHDPNEMDAFEPVTWMAGSPWGNFTFRLSKPAPSFI
ncbi:hypothetical protein SEPCBS119000_003195 [Sporothrix epigloea]|uniref:Uncharacterized protein n=1 Tax=Sporothrix epigloea TaxID=1892477 RepID=A0ABP0DKA9_9PEZI